MQTNASPRAVTEAERQETVRKNLEALLAAIAAYREGRHADAQALCRRVVAELPELFEAVHLLGVSVLDCGQHEEARGILERAVALNPGSADAHSNLGFALLRLDRCEEARAAYEKAIALKPDFPMALKNLGSTLLRLQLPEQAIAAFTRSIELKGDDADVYCNRAVAEIMLQRYEAAAISAESALALQPRHFEAMVDKGLAHLELRHFGVAETAFNAALAIRPNMAELLAHRGRLYMQLARRTEAEADYDAALALEPTLEMAWRGKAQICLITGRVAQAITACTKALELDSASEIALTMLGWCHGKLGETAAAIQYFDQALAIKPDCDTAIVNKIYHLDFLPGADFAIQQAARKHWWNVIGSRFAGRKLVPRSLDPQKRIVVGYVSSDFRTHSAAFAFLPVLRSHDKASFQINCYSCSPLRDSLTETFRSLADVWVDALGLSDDELADRIEADGVDILVDLSGHTTGNRLNVFARKPAPVQVTAWGHATGTGLQTMDYLFSDPMIIPANVRHLFAERIYDLPSVITIDPVADAKPSALPMLKNGYVTFGVFNRIDKISDQALAVWSRLLHAVTGSKIMIKHVALDDALVRDALLGRFIAQGISQDRVVCMGTTARHDHLQALADVDISLDPFPQNGGVSTWESLHMGVPVVARLGNGTASRISGALLNAIGLDDWVASDDDGYLAIAERFAAMPAELQKLRTELPARIANSPAGNVSVYTEHVEAGYRQFWRDYCAGASGNG